MGSAVQLAQVDTPVRPSLSSAGRSGADGVRVAPPADLTAKSYILMDYASGLTLAERDPQIEREPASLTKIMTAYVVFGEIASGRLSLDEGVLISERAWRTGMTGASRMFIEVGQTVSVSDLLRGMIVQSGNDASTALAERIAGSESAFVELMNRTARDLGMHQTIFANSHGLPSEDLQFTTPLDMALLARALIRDYPDLYQIYSERSFQFAGISQQNRNLLLWREGGFDGLKTGWTSAAGYNLVSSAERDGRRLIAVVMGIDAPNHQAGGTIRANESQALIQWGFRFTEPRRVFEAGTVLETPRVYRGDVGSVSAGVLSPVWVAVPPGEGDRLRAELDLPGPIEAPLAIGDTVGELRVLLGSDTIARVPVVALESVELGGWLGRQWDALRLTLRSWRPW
ncbi:MAG: D-alanyl-D-alanine carboxypeptidase family protein [Thioalkalivibrionaceae bacterium]